MTCEELRDALDEMPPEASIAYDDQELGITNVKTVEFVSNDLVMLR